MISQSRLERFLVHILGRALWPVISWEAEDSAADLSFGGIVQARREFSPQENSNEQLTVWFEASEKNYIDRYTFV